MAKSLVPFSRNRMLMPWHSEDPDPFHTMRREVNRLFNDAFGGFGLPSLFGPATVGMPLEMLDPQMDVSETEHEIQITAELPGVDGKDVEVLLADDQLTIHGETKANREQKERNYHLTERRLGSFSRSLRLPFAVDPNQVKAAFKDGLLTITVAKPQEVLEKQHRIEVQSDAGTSGTQESPSRPEQATSQSGAQTGEMEAAAE